MEGYIFEWLNLLGRWAHMITGIAWIGASFYFVWLDNSLEAPKNSADAERGVGGEIWSVHGGGVYHAQKYTVAPPKLPDNLHWFKWEAYTTWITGMYLLALMYWYRAEVYLIDPSVMNMSKPVAVKSKLGEQENKLSAAMLVFISVTAFILCQIFSGRGAYIHFGAMLGSIMVANVFFTIMPGQRDLVAAKQEGRAPDPRHAIRAKQRSVHNTFFTLPVLFVMISNHYSMTWGHEYNWLILIALSVAGAMIRVFFVQRHHGKQTALPLAIAAVLIMGTAFATVPKPRTVVPTDSTVSSADLFGQVHTIIEARCSSCHAHSPTQAGFSAPPKGIVFETQDSITKAMPIGNLTQITDEERDVIDQWFQQGAKPE